MTDVAGQSAASDFTFAAHRYWDYLDPAAMRMQGRFRTHPGPVFVTVTQGSITWFDGSDPLCVSQTYGVGDSFIEDAMSSTTR